MAELSNGPQNDPAARQDAAANVPPSDGLSPADRYEELFEAVQRQSIFTDSKTFVDCAPRSDPQDILRAYRQESTQPCFDLRGFVKHHFSVQHHAAKDALCAPGQPMADHIDGLWDLLTRHPSGHPHRGSLLRLPHRYVVPGGRFVEMYYWDSYFTMLGLAKGGRRSLLHAMTDNFAYLIDTYGHVPNGTRTYYLSRSQPPVFALMAELCEDCGGQRANGYLPQMLREHAFWMDGADGLQAGHARRRVVALPDGSVLNRYWDDRDTPREEAWREDMQTAARSGRPPAEVYRDLRAAAESGWDFSSRWLEHPRAAKTGGMADRLQAMSTIITTRILPVDLNALLHKLETSIAGHARHRGDNATADAFDATAGRRRKAMDQYLWNTEAGAFLDFDWTLHRPRTALNAAAAVPLFTGTATAGQATSLADSLRKRLLITGGLATSECASGEQWDSPNGWAPLQWMAAEGLQAYGHAALAQDIRQRWLATVEAVYRDRGKLVEKYELGPHAHARVAGGGEYPLQDGFGWTNGVVRQWLATREKGVEPAALPL